MSNHHPGHPGWPPYKYPHTHYRHNDPLEAIKYLNTAIVRIEHYLKWLTKTTNDDTIHLIEDILKLVVRIQEMIAEISAAMKLNNDAKELWQEQIISSVDTIMTIVETVLDQNDGLIKCIEDTLLKHKLQIELIFQYLEELTSYVTGFSKTRFERVIAIDANVSDLFYGNSIPAAILQRMESQIAAADEADIYMVYPNGFFATENRIDSFLGIGTGESPLKNASNQIVPNNYAIPVIGEISEAAGTFSIEVACSNDGSSSILESLPKFAFGNYYTRHVNADGGVMRQFPPLAHGNTSLSSSAWLVMKITKPEYANIINRDDVMLSITQGGVTTWNFGLFETTDINTDHPLSNFADRMTCPCTWGVDHRAGLWRLPNGATYIYFICNSTNDGFNNRIGDWAVYQGRTGLVGCADTLAFNVTVTIHSPSAMAEYSSSNGARALSVPKIDYSKFNSKLLTRVEV